MKSILDTIFVRDKHVCPWYCCFTFDNIFRKLFQNPYEILSQHIKSGDYVLDIGPGQGYFTIPIAKMVGEKGKVIAIDIQAKMLEILEKKASVANVQKRIVTQLIKDETFGSEYPADFALAFWMVHEVPNRQMFLQSIYNSLQPGGNLLIAEPLLHVTAKSLDETIKIAENIGFQNIARPKIFFSRSVLLEKQIKS